MRAEEAGEFKNSQETLTWRGSGRGAKGKGIGELLGESEEVRAGEEAGGVGAGGDLQGAKEGRQFSQSLEHFEGQQRMSSKGLEKVQETEGWGRVF